MENLQSGVVSLTQNSTQMLRRLDEFVKRSAISVHLGWTLYPQIVNTQQFANNARVGVWTKNSCG